MNIIYVVLVLGALIGCNQKTANNYVDSAKQYIAQNKYQAATIELKNALQEHPELAEARFLLGKVYLHNKQYAGAEKELNRALTYKYPANEVIPLLSKAYKQSKADIALLELPHDQAQLSPAESVEIAFYKLQAYMRLDQDLKAKALIEEIKGITSDSPFKQLFLVYSLLLSNNADAALLALNNVLAQNPEQADALKLKANLLLQQDKIELAVDVYRQYFTFHPADKEMAFVFARLLSDVDLSAEAEPIIDNLLKINKDNMLLNQMKSVARFDAQDNANALLYSEKALETNPGDAPLRLIAGYSAYLLDDFERAHQHLSMIADQLAPDHKALRLLAASQLKLGLDLQAGDTLQLLDDVTAQDTTLFSSVGLALISKGEILQAQSLLDKSSGTSDSVDGLTRLGMLKLSLNDASGLAHIEQALEQAPDQQSTRITLATAYLSTGQTEKAILLANRWKQSAPQDPKAYMLAGMAYMKAKNYAQARSEFEQLLTKAPSNIRAKLALIDLAHFSGDNQKAQAQLHQLLKTHPGNSTAYAKLYLLIQQQGEPRQLLQDMRSQVQLNPDNIELKLILAKILITEQLFDQALQLLEAMPAPQRESPTYKSMLGQTYLSLQQVDNAQAHYQKWVQQAPTNKTAVLGNLLIMDIKADYKKALEMINHYAKKRALDVEIQLLHTQFLIMAADFAGANKSYHQLPEEMLKHAYVKGLLGQLQIHAQDYQGALTNILLAYRSKSSSRNVSLVYFCYRKLKQNQASYDFLLTHTKNNPDDLASLMLLAGIQIKIDKDLAIKSYHQAVALKPDNFVALNNMAYFYLKQQKLDQAQKYAEQAIALRPHHAAVQDTMAQILMAKKQYQSALAYLTKAVSDKHVKDEIYLNYIEALLLNQQQNLAMRKIDQRKFTLEDSLNRLDLIKKKYELPY